MLKELVSEDDASCIERYKKAAYTVMLGKKCKVDDLMEEIF